MSSSLVIEEFSSSSGFSYSPTTKMFFLKILSNLNWYWIWFGVEKDSGKRRWKEQSIHRPLCFRWRELPIV